MVLWKPKLSREERPVYRALSEALRADVASGKLKPGDRLPTHRELAALLELSVGTVTRAYQDAEARGVTESAPGRGTFVRDVRANRPVVGPIPTQESHLVDLGLAHPHYGQDPDLAAALRSLALRVDIQRLLRYQSLASLPRFGESAARWLRACGVPTDSTRVVVTAGAQHAVFVLLSALTSPGDLVLLDSITYPGALSAAELTGRSVRGVPMDQEGMIPEALRNACKRERAKALYLIPTIHNPTGILMPAERRMEIAAIAEEHDLLVIEDDTLRLLAPDPPPTVSSFLPERGIFIAGMSKSVAGGLRVAFLDLPSGMAERVNTAIGASVFMLAPLLVELAVTWIEDGTAARTVELKRSEARERTKLAEEILGRGRFTPHPGSYYFWLELPEGWTSADFVVEARRKGVGVTPSRPFSPGAFDTPNAVRICLSAAENRTDLRTGLQTLRGMLTRPGSGSAGVL